VADAGDFCANGTRIVTLQIHVQLDYWFEQACDALLQVEAAAITGQVIRQAHITVTPCDHFARVPAQDHIGERIWLRVAGRVLVDYRAMVAIEPRTEDCANLPSVPPHRLPGEAVPYLLPSRYCPSNQFTDFVETTFGAIEGGAKIAAMREWVAGHLSYVPGASDTDTTAADTFRTRAGVCRDYAHLLIALARAADIPARIASVYALGVTPPDFHAVAEVFLDGGWHLVDPTGMARPNEMAKIGIGRDIGDVAFLTAFGQLRMISQNVSVEAAVQALCAE
jgi:transglutaminase-like putative cysteine protease